MQSLPPTSVANNWIKFVVSSCPLSKCFSLGSWVFHPLQSYISKFQFNPEAEGHRFVCCKIDGHT